MLANNFAETDSDDLHIVISKIVDLKGQGLYFVLQYEDTSVYCLNLNHVATFEVIFPERIVLRLAIPSSAPLHFNGKTAQTLIDFYTKGLGVNEITKPARRLKSKR